MVFTKNKQNAKNSFDGGGIVLFQDVTHAIAAEKAIRKGSYGMKLVAPPPELRMGCDLAIEINLVEQPGIERLLASEDTPYVKVAPLKKGTTELLNIVRLTDYDRWMMVRAGNMKLAYDKTTGTIVNVSGGGCPDVPYLNIQLVGKHLMEAPRPRDLGFTLCAMMLDAALLEGQRLWQEGD
ncbi:MAG: DUF3343 domain-containing protein [Chloroflexota bacterium]